jgi:hypothetical protein
MHRTPLIHTLGRLAAVGALLIGLLLLQGRSRAAAVQQQDVVLNVPSAFASVNVPDHYLRHRHALGELTPLTSALDFADATFHLRPALNGTPGAVSFESVNFQGQYLRHQDYRIKLSADDGVTRELFQQDASFTVRSALSGTAGAVSFESVNFPGHYIRHQNFELWLANKDAGNTSLFPQDVSFRQGHTASLAVAQSRASSGLKEFDTTFTNVDAHLIQEQTRGRVGWGQGDGLFALVRQLAVHFDTAPLDRTPEKRIDRAVLTYDESPNCADPPFADDSGAGRYITTCWANGDGEPQDKPNGCVVVRVPAQAWRDTPPATAGLRPYITHPSGRPTVTRLGPRAWDVTEPFSWQTVPDSMEVSNPAGLPLSSGHGFLLTGEITSLDQLTGDDSTFCLSTVSTIRLQVIYTVPAEGGPGPIVR